MKGLMTYNILIFSRLINRLRVLFQCRFAGWLPRSADVIKCSPTISPCVEAYPLTLMPATQKLALLGRFDFEILSLSAAVPYPGERAITPMTRRINAMRRQNFSDEEQNQKFF